MLGGVGLGVGGVRLWRLKRSRDLSLEEIAKYYVNTDSVLHAQLISEDPELKGQIINSGVRVILAGLLSWRGWSEGRGRASGGKVPPPTHTPPPLPLHNSPTPVCVEHAAIRGEFGHGGWR